MKAGDKVWVPATASIVFPSGDVWFTDRGGFNIQRVEQSIPHTDALPAVARWLAEYGDALRYGQHTPGDWLDVVEAAFDEQDDAVDRLMLQEQVVPALRALLAALTTEGNG